jgi:N-acetylmuramoyl-L-alanine amidase
MGKKKGAVSPTGLPEHIPTLDIARRLAQLLTSVKARVNFTRLDNYYVPVTDRIQLCRELKPTLFLSIATWVKKENPSQASGSGTTWATKGMNSWPAAWNRKCTVKLASPPMVLDLSI